MAIPISSTRNTPRVGPEGFVPAGQNARVSESAVASETIPVGCGVVAEVSGFTEVSGSVQLPNPATADDDALVVSTTALGAATEQTYELADFTGAYAGERLNPPRPGRIVTASDADWDASTVTFEGEDADGNYLKSTVSLGSASGGETLDTDDLFAVFTKVTIAAQTGNAEGSLGVGPAPANGGIDLAGVVAHSDQLTASLQGVTSVSEGGDYVDGEDLSLLKRGRIVIHSENAAKKGDPVYVRHTSDGGSNTQTGKFRSTPDGTRCYRASGWLFATDSSGSDNAAEIERR